MTLRYTIIATVYPDLDESCAGPALSLEDQVRGVEREWPVLFDTRAQADAAMPTVAADPSFAPGAALRIDQVEIDTFVGGLVPELANDYRHRQRR